MLDRVGDFFASFPFRSGKNAAGVNMWQDFNVTISFWSASYHYFNEKRKIVRLIRNEFSTLRFRFGGFHTNILMKMARS